MPVPLAKKRSLKNARQQIKNYHLKLNSKIMSSLSQFFDIVVCILLAQVHSILMRKARLLCLIQRKHMMAFHTTLG